MSAEVEELSGVGAVSVLVVAAISGAALVAGVASLFVVAAVSVAGAALVVELSGTAVVTALVVVAEVSGAAGSVLAAVFVSSGGGPAGVTVAGGAGVTAGTMLLDCTRGWLVNPVVEGEEVVVVSGGVEAPGEGLVGAGIPVLSAVVGGTPLVSFALEGADSSLPGTASTEGAGVRRLSSSMRSSSVVGGVMGEPRMSSCSCITLEVIFR